MAEFLADLIGFLVVVAVIWWKVVPPVRKMMRAQQDTIRGQLELSKQTSERLAEAERAYQDALVQAREESAKIRDNARADAQRIVEEMRVQADREAERIRLRAQADLANHLAQASRELRIYLGDATLAVADRLVEQHLADASARGATVDRFLDKLDSMSARDEAATSEPSLVASKGES